MTQYSIPGIKGTFSDLTAGNLSVPGIKGIIGGVGSPPPAPPNIKPWHATASIPHEPDEEFLLRRKGVVFQPPPINQSSRFRRLEAGEEQDVELAIHRRLSPVSTPNPVIATGFHRLPFLEEPEDEDIAYRLKSKKSPPSRRRLRPYFVIN